MYDMIVVGGGPAGMTAALYALRNGKSVLVIERETFGGQITHSPKVENFPGTLSMSGTEFADSMLDQILTQGADIEIDAVASVIDEGSRKVVITEEGAEYEGKTVVIAVGVKHRLLGLPGEGELTGEGVSYCAVCDGDFYSGRTVCVAGGGNSALQEAILLSDKCREVIMLQDLPYFTGEEKLREVLFARENVRAVTNTKITRLITEDGKFTGVGIEDRTTGAASEIACDGIFVAIGLIPENDVFSDVAELDGRGYFASGEDCMTDTPGVFVAGDCRAKTVRQLTTAAADGATAALAACNYINTL